MGYHFSHFLLYALIVKIYARTEAPPTIFVLPNQNAYKEMNAVRSEKC